MSGSCVNPRRQRRRRHPAPQPRLLRLRRPRRRPQPRRPLLPQRRRPPQPRLLLRPVHRLLSRRPRQLPHLHRLPPQVDRLQRRVATRGVTRRQSRQRTVAQGERIAALVAPRHSKTIARALPRTSYQNGSVGNPTWRGRVSMVSAVAPGAVVNTDLLPRQRALRETRRFGPAPYRANGLIFIWQWSCFQRTLLHAPLAAASSFHLHLGTPARTTTMSASPNVVEKCAAAPRRGLRHR